MRASLEAKARAATKRLRGLQERARKLEDQACDESYRAAVLAYGQWAAGELSTQLKLTDPQYEFREWGSFWLPLIVTMTLPGTWSPEALVDWRHDVLYPAQERLGITGTDIADLVLEVKPEGWVEDPNYGIRHWMSP